MAGSLAAQTLQQYPQLAFSSSHDPVTLWGDITKSILAAFKQHRWHQNDNGSEGLSGRLPFGGYDAGAAVLLRPEKVSHFCGKLFLLSSRHMGEKGKVLPGGRRPRRYRIAHE